MTVNYSRKDSDWL